MGRTGRASRKKGFYVEEAGECGKEEGRRLVTREERGTGGEEERRARAVQSQGCTRKSTAAEDEELQEGTQQRPWRLQDQYELKFADSRWHETANGQEDLAEAEDPDEQGKSRAGVLAGQQERTSKEPLLDQRNQNRNHKRKESKADWDIEIGMLSVFICSC
jgi:hypothetical protein